MKEKHFFNNFPRLLIRSVGRAADYFFSQENCMKVATAEPTTGWRTKAQTQAKGIPDQTGLTQDQKRFYIAEIERLTTPQVRARFLGEVDEAARLIDHLHLNPNTFGAEEIKETIEQHQWKRDACQALIEQRNRMTAMTSSVPHGSNGHESNSEFAGLPLTEAGNAEAFAQIFQDSVRYDHRRNRWMIWKSPRWHADADGEIYRLALNATRERGRAAFEIESKEERVKAVRWALQSESRQKLKAMLDGAQSMTPITDTGADWDKGDWFLGCENGMIDLQEGALREGDASHRITLSTGIHYNESAQCPRWLQFLDEVFGDEKLIEFIQRAVGYSLTGDISEQVLFLCYGNGANGKSVFLAILRAILGDYAANTPFSTFETLDRNGSTNDIAALVGKRLITSSETRENARMNEARVKALTGGDPLTARFLFGEFFTFEPKGKIWLAVNHRPRVSDDSYGFWRRVRLIPFEKTFGPDKADPRLLDKLRDELPGILAWAALGCLDWQRDGMKPPEIVTAATEEYRVESDVLARFFEEKCELAEGKQETAGALYKGYEAWAEENGENKIGSQSFRRRLGEKGLNKKRERDQSGKVKVFYTGIKLI